MWIQTNRTAETRVSLVRPFTSGATHDCKWFCVEIKHNHVVSSSSNQFLPGHKIKADKVLENTVRNKQTNILHTVFTLGIFFFSSLILFRHRLRRYINGPEKPYLMWNAFTKNEKKKRLSLHIIMFDNEKL